MKRGCVPCSPRILELGVESRTNTTLPPSLSQHVTELTHFLSPQTTSPREVPLWCTAYEGPSSILAEPWFFPPAFQPSYSQPPYNQGGYSQGYTAPPPPPPPPPAYNYGSYGGYNPAPYTPPPPPTAQTYPQPSYNQYQQVGARLGVGQRREGTHKETSRGPAWMCILRLGSLFIHTTEMG